MSQVKMKALRSFSSTVWGNVEQDAAFYVDPGYVEALEKDGIAERVKKEVPRDADGLRTDGPTVAEYAAKGYDPFNYPPKDYASRSTPEEIAEAIKVYDEKHPATKKAPKIAKFVADGGDPHKYPPRGFLSNSTPEEIAAAAATYDLEQAAKNAAGGAQ